ncbi:hypothetical protein DVJ77_15790 [Dyella tabacisoli]|uniref:Uncharacterized protein n=1 Tax=Dyella tabacisoli TaxID=2282381 RepID=A0A369UK36_9GAMM|nr:hypothetical protein DVJ77_15790 [Dyella tabacisoli]
MHRLATLEGPLGIQLAAAATRGGDRSVDGVFRREGARRRSDLLIDVDTAAQLDRGYADGGWCGGGGCGGGCGGWCRRGMCCGGRCRCRGCFCFFLAACAQGEHRDQ